MKLDETHDPALEGPAGYWPIQCLPYGVFSTADDRQPRPGVAIGDFVFDLRGVLDGHPMALPKGQREELRLRLSRMLRSGTPPQPLIPLTAVTMHLPAAVGDYTDFYASRHHAERVGRLFRPDQPLLPNYDWVPIAYHGRASTVVPSGTPIRRPSGQLSASPEGPPRFAPTEKLDYEVELGVFIGGPANQLGEPVAIGHAEERLFGVCLLNDWSARDIQRWEYQPLGPFLGKNFATTISPWVIPMEALEPFRCPTRRKVAPVLPYLEGRPDAAYSLWLEAWVNGKRISRSTVADLHWTLAQMVAHHASNGCVLRPGDLFGTGTVSGPGDDERGCLLEAGGPFLRDGDEVELRGEAITTGFRSLPLGVARGFLQA